VSKAKQSWQRGGTKEDRGSERHHKKFKAVKRKVAVGPMAALSPKGGGSGRFWRKAQRGKVEAQARKTRAKRGSRANEKKKSNSGRR